MKKILGILLAVLLTFSFLTGCSGQSAKTTSKPGVGQTESESREETRNEGAGAEASTKTEMPQESSEATEVVVKPEDPYAEFEVTDEFIDTKVIGKSSGMIRLKASGFFIKKGDKKYLAYLDSYPVQKAKVPIMTWTSDVNDYLLSEDIPVMTIEKEDMVFDKGILRDIILEPVNITGFTIPLVMAESSSHTPHSGFLRFCNEESFEIKDENGNVVAAEDRLNLEHGKTYTVTYAEGTALKVQEFVADFVIYSDDINKEELVIKGEPTVEGHAVYDFSSVEPGFYFVAFGYGGIIEVK
ncbi:MAG: hypothetical protein ACOX75_06880 [Lachnospiraceae bacterium]